MDVVLAQPTFKPYQIRQINYCRLYLRVITIADITTAAGTHIDAGVYDGLPSAINRNPNWCHSHQARPGSTAWSHWRRFCNLICTSRGSRKLRVSLGHWTVPHYQIRKQWDHWLDRPALTLYCRRADGTFTSHRKLHHDYDCDPTAANVLLPARASPVDVKPQTSGTWSVPVHFRNVQPPVPTPLPAVNDYHQYVTTLSTWEKSLLEGVEFLVPQQQLFEAMARESAWICSDGAQVGNKASFGWVVSNQDGLRMAQCSGPCYGADPTSYRAEGYGLLSICRFLQGMRHQFGTNIQQCHVWCDNKTMVNRINNRPKDLDRIYPNEKLASEWDVLLEIWHSLLDYEEENHPTFSHVKGHQDRDKPYHKLSLQAQLNVDADKLADGYITDNPNLDYSTTIMMPHTEVLLHLTRGTLTYKLKRALRMERTGPPLLKKLQEKYKWSDATAQDINWEAARLAMNRLRRHKLVLTKHINNVAPLGWLVHIYDKKYPPNCPSCDAPEETRVHLYQCSGPRRMEWRTSFRNQLVETLTKQDTAIDLQNLLLEGIFSVIEGRDPDTIQVPETEAAVAVFNSQSKIGWPELFKGRLSKEWATRQQEFLGEFKPKKNGNTWAISVAQELLSGWHNLWKSRNEDRHGRDRQTKAAAERAQAIRELDQLYSLKGNVEPRLDWILATPLEQRKNLRTYHIRAFINCFGPILEESFKDQLATQ